METKRYITWFVGRVLAPAFTYTVLEKLTEHAVVAIGVTVALVGLAFFLPSLTTVIFSLDAGLEYLRTARRTRLLTACRRFMEAYKRVLTKYPPTLLPAEAAASVTAQLEIFSRAFRRLRGRNAQRFTTPYDLVRSLQICPEHFHGWSLSDCILFMTDLRDALSQTSYRPFQIVVQQLDVQTPHLRWLDQLEVVERSLDREVQAYLAQWPLLQRIRTQAAICASIIPLLSLDAVYRQAGVQTALLRHLPDWPPREIQEFVGHLRYDAVVKALQLSLEGNDAAY